MRCSFAVDEAAAANAIDIGHILDVHRVLLARAVNSDHIAGVFRSTQNWIGGNDYNPCGADFVPPPPGQVDRLLDDLIRFANDESLPPLTHAAYAHAQFETIHPFIDGNGRTGRPLVESFCVVGVSPPTSFRRSASFLQQAKAGDSIEGLVAFREGRKNNWLEMFAVAAARAAELAASYLGHVQNLQESWRDQAAAVVKRADAAAWLLIGELPGYPIITTAVAVARTGRSRPQVQLAIDQLVKAGVLVPLSESKRNRQWEAVGLLDLLADMEAAHPRR